MLAVITYFPIFTTLTQQANPALYEAQQTIPVVIAADPAECHVQFNPTGTAVYTSSCDIAKQVLASMSIPYRMEAAAPGSIASIRAGFVDAVPSFDAVQAGARAGAQRAALNRYVAAALVSAGYPPAANPSVVKMYGAFDLGQPRVLTIIGLLTVLVIYVTMVYGPVAAALVELFPSRIRYTAMSLPYHVGNGWFGGLLPAATFAMIAATGNIYFGLWYPVVFAAITVAVGALFLPETKDRDIFADDHAGHRG